MGTWLAFVWGVCGLFGTYLGGVLAGRYAAQREELQMRAVAVIFVLCGLLYILAYIIPSKYLAMLLMTVSGLLFSLCGGPILSAIASLSNDRMRSIAIALIFLFANFIGYGFGPILAGVLSDLLEPIVGSESLRYTLVLLSPGYLWVAYFYWQASKTIEEDIQQVESESETELVEEKASSIPELEDELSTDPRSAVADAFGPGKA